MDINGIKSRGKLSKELKQWYPFDWDFINCRQTGIFQCAYCGHFFPTKEITEDHVYPRSLGGPRIVTTACQPCNNEKGDKLPIEWAIDAYKQNIDTGVGFGAKQIKKRAKNKKISSNSNSD